MNGLVGIFGRPYVDLERYVDTAALDAIHDEVCYALCRLETSYTGGSLKWMGVVAPSVRADAYPDYGHVIERFTREEFEIFVSLADHPRDFEPARHREYTFGDETDHPLNREQMLYLKYRYGVYFPWKVTYHFVENHRWADKNSGAGKGFTDDAKELFPRTVAFLERLPFREIGRCVLFGLEANDHAPLHRDTEPGAGPIGHSISICPQGDKRFYLCDAAEQTRTPVSSRVYWFNDMDYHGVLADPFFRYSIRVDGVFEASFLARLSTSVPG